MTLIEYKKVFLKYAPINTFSAGVELLGNEVKALREHQGTLDGARVIVRHGEAYLVGMTIPPYQVNNTDPSYDPERTRRLLLTKGEIHQVANAEDKKGLTVVPIEVYTKGELIKVKVAVVRGKGKDDRREDLKRREAQREQERALKTY